MILICLNILRHLLLTILYKQCFYMLNNYSYHNSILNKLKMFFFKLKCPSMNFKM